ncbi:MAG TPA: DUF2087 domain-containing protein [Frankiaceae bacterium]|jgi:hypothetical protein|nr:DUF2087 domain-containing protein [Frankiaceae bacterium]
MSDAATLLGLLADEDRLRVVAALVLGATTATEVRDATGLDARVVGRALARLEDAGVVVASGTAWTVDVARLQEAARVATPVEEYEGADAETAKVLRSFLRDGRLVRMPAQRSKRRVLLDHVVQVFEPGQRYDEKEVNALLRAFSDDYVTIRRYLVDEDLLSREHGVYWRSGGTFAL